MGAALPLAAEATREEFWGMPTWQKVCWYVLAGLSTLVFAYAVLKPIAKYVSGRGGGWPPLPELPGRLRRAVVVALSHTALRRRDPYAGIAHLAIFYGFMVLFAGTIVLAINTDMTEPLLGWRFFQGDFYLGYSIVLDVLGIALLAGLAMMMVRRGIIRPRKLSYERPDRKPGDPQYDRRRYVWGDWTFLGLLLVITLSGYVLEGARIAMDGPGYDEFSPFGWLTARAFEGVGDGTLGELRRWLWWFHGLLAIAFVSVLPWTKGKHMLTSLASMVFVDDRAGKRLRAIPAERADEPAGYASLADFMPVHLLHLDACTKCGRCHDVCPANAVGMPLSPRDVVLELRQQADAGWHEVGVPGVLGALMGKRGSEGPLATEVMGEDGVRSETIWSCMQCNACVEACPVDIEQAPIINQLRRHQIEEGEVDANLQSTLQTIHKTGNSFGENRRKRGRWTKELDFDVHDARERPVDILWFVGDYASFDPRSQRVSRALARILARAGVDFGILYDGESNGGNDVRRAGEEGLFEALAENNVETLAECDFKRVLTTDPHSLNTLRQEYPDFGGTWDVVHHTALLLELLESGGLQLDKPLGYRVTYHDPCYLGRMNGGYDAPREVLRHLGCELVEMPRNRDNSFCCGAGGGRIWIADDFGARERPSENRIREAIGLGQLDYFVVSCPKDVTMYEDAIKTSGHQDDLELRELTELVEEALAPAPEPVVVSP